MSHHDRSFKLAPVTLQTERNESKDYCANYAFEHGFCSVCDAVSEADKELNRNETVYCVQFCSEWYAVVLNERQPVRVYCKKDGECVCFCWQEDGWTKKEFGTQMNLFAVDGTAPFTSDDFTSGYMTEIKSIDSNTNATNRDGNACDSDTARILYGVMGMIFCASGIEIGDNPDTAKAVLGHYFSHSCAARLFSGIQREYQSVRKRKGKSYYHFARVSGKQILTQKEQNTYWKEYGGDVLDCLSLITAASCDSNPTETSEDCVSENTVCGDIPDCKDFSDNIIYRIYKRAARENGVHVISVPTGSGKSYALAKYIADMIQEEPDKHHVIISTLWTNLTTAEQDLIRNGCRPDDIYTIRSVTDNAVRFFGKYSAKKISVPEKFQQRETFEKLQYYTHRLKELTKTKGNAEEKQFLKQDVDRTTEDVGNCYTALKNELRKSLCDGNEGNPVKNASEILKKPEYEWIADLYPDSLIDDKKVLILTSNKALRNISAPFDRLGQMSIAEYIDSDSDAVIYLDESDSCKDNMRSVLIENSDLTAGYNLKNFGKWTLDAISVFRDETGNISENDKGKYLYKQCLEYDKKYGSDRMVKKLKELIKISYAVTETCMLDIPWRLDDDVTENIFLYATGTSACLAGKHSDAYLYKNEEEGVAYVTNDEEKAKKAGSYVSVTQCVSKILGLLRFFDKGILRHLAAQKERQLRYKYKQETAKREAYSYMADDLGLSSDLKNFLVDSSSMINIPDNSDFHTEDDSVYDTGFVACWLNGGNEQNVSLDAVAVHQTPEMIAAKIAKEHPVLLISATADSESIRNFSLSYFERKGILHYLEDNEKSELLSYLKYDDLEQKMDVRIYSPDYCQAKNKSLSDYCESLFSIDIGSEPKRLAEREKYVCQASRLLAPFGNTDGLYIAARYCFAVHGIILSLVNNTHLILDFCKKKYVEFNEDNKKAIPGYYNNNTFGDYAYCNYYMEKLCGYAEEYYFGEATVKHFSFTAETGKNDSQNTAKRNKNNLETFLTNKVAPVYKAGNAVVVHTTDKTAAIGMNFKMTPRETDELIEYNMHGESNSVTECDFNAVILHELTYVIVESTEGTDKFKQTKDKKVAEIRRTFDVEEMYEIGAISLKEKYKFLRLRGKTDKKSSAYCNEVARITEQILGRTMRTPWKSPVFSLIMSPGITYALAGAEIPDNAAYKPPVFKKAYAYALENVRPTKKTAAERDMERTHERTVEDVHYLIHRENGEFVNKEAYIEYGNNIMKGGRQISEHTYQSLDDLAQRAYSYSPDGVNRYWYTRSEDGKSVKVFFNVPPKSNGVMQVSDEASKLTNYMKIPKVKRYFVEHGFATGDEHIHGPSYMLTPAAFNDVYKGRLSETVSRSLFADQFELFAEDITNPKLFELADFTVKNIAVDVKQWTRSFAESTDKETLYFESAMKTAQLGLSKLVFIMPLADELLHTSYWSSVKLPDGSIIEIAEIPGIYYMENGIPRLNESAEKFIVEEIVGK